jgi:hypothetical protein
LLKPILAFFLGVLAAEGANRASPSSFWRADQEEEEGEEGGEAARLFRRRIIFGSGEVGLGVDIFEEICEELGF